MSKPNTDEIKKILADADITLEDVVTWYIDYVLKSC